MKTIYIDVKDSYVNNVLSMLESIKGIMLNRIDVVTEKPLQPDDQNDDVTAFESLQESIMSKTWENNADKAWDAL